MHLSHQRDRAFLTFAFRFGEGLCECWNQGTTGDRKPFERIVDESQDRHASLKGLKLI
jgi:hypothetical protein